MTVQRPPVRLAVLGAGAIAQVVHLPMLARMRGVQIAAVLDVERTTARTIAQRFGVEKVARTLDEVVADPSIHGVVVCTPPHLHEEHVREALQAGKYVLCEKPLSLTSDGVQRILAEDGAAGRLMVAMNQRFRTDAAALRSFVSSGELGDVYYLKTGWLNRPVTRGKARSWRERKETAGGGAFMDLGLQMLDMALWILGYPKPERLTAHLHHERGREVEDSAAVMVRLEGDRLVNLECTWSLRAERDRQFLHVLASAGSGSLSPLAVYKDMESGLANVTPPQPQGRENPWTASYRAELAHFVEVVRGMRTADLPREHVTLMRLAEAVYRSAAEGREVEV
jgi:predicted dehydrogenase